MDDNQKDQNMNDSIQPEETPAEKPVETTEPEATEETTPESKEEDSGQARLVSDESERARMTTEEKSESTEAQVNEPNETPATEESATPDEPAPVEEPEASEPAAEPTQESVSPAKNDNPNAKWYVVHTYSGHENKVSHTLKQRVESEHLEEKILEVLVPTQDKIEIKSGKKVNVKEKIFPGYILVKMVLDDLSWLAVRTTQGVTGFVGIGNKPTPISDAEVQTIVKFTQTEAPMYKQVFMANDTVKIVDGPFADFIGKVDNVDEERGKVKVLVSIFGRETPVELDFLQVQKL